MGFEKVAGSFRRSRLETPRPAIRRETASGRAQQAARDSTLVAWDLAADCLVRSALRPFPRSPRPAHLLSEVRPLFVSAGEPIETAVDGAPSFDETPGASKMPRLVFSKRRVPRAPDEPCRIPPRTWPSFRLARPATRSAQAPRGDRRAIRVSWRWTSPSPAVSSPRSSCRGIAACAISPLA